MGSKKVMDIFIDIETLRSPLEHKAELLKQTIENFKAPSSLTKTQAAKDLGITDAKDIKFTSASDMIARWEKELASEKAESVANELWEKTSFNPEVAPIACICISYFYEQTSFEKTFACGDSQSEWAMLDEFHRFIERICGNHGEMIYKPNFIGHNLAKFDLPFIWKRSIINGVKPCEGVKWIDAKHGYNCYDTMIAWAGFGKMIGGGRLAEILGIQGKTDGMDGSMVYDTWQENPQKVIDYCHDDVAMVKATYVRLSL